MPVRIGFVGAGMIAKHHLKEMAEIPEAEVAAVCDIDRGRAEQAAATFNATVHIQYRTMIESEPLDALYVCLPPFAHGEVEQMALEAGLHLFIEKPIALSVEKATRIQQAAQKAGVVTAVGYQWRYLSCVDRAKDILGDRPVAMVRGQWIGGMPSVEWWRVKEKSGGQIVEQTTHLFDLARYFAGDARSVYALGFQGINAPRTPHYNVEDASAVVVQFQSNTIGSFASADIASLGSGAMLTFLADNLLLEIGSNGLDVLEPGKRTHFDAEGSAIATEDRAFVNAVASKDPSAVKSTYADAVKTLAVTLAANQSMESGKVVYVQ